MSDEARMWTELGRLGEDPLPGEASDAELVEAALAGLAEPGRGPGLAEPGRGSSRRPRVATAIAVVVVLAAAVVVGWWLVPRMRPGVGETRDSAEMSPAVVDEAVAGGQAVSRGAASGSVAPRERGLADLEPDAIGTGAEETEAGADEAGADETGADEAGETDAAEPSREPAPRRPAAPRTAEALLELAQRLAAEGDHVAAIGAYERLVSRFPQSAEGKAARVSLGRLELRRGRAREALAQFDAYLASSAGALVEEARYGRIRALRRLGRAEQEHASILAFLADHAESLYAARLRKRAEELAAR